ncbi:hypothetical protein ACS0TY_026416 [Phlomoides rotata]
MVAYPYKDEVTGLVDNGNDVVESVDGFIDQHVIDIELCFMFHVVCCYSNVDFTMDGNYGAPRAIRGRKSGGSTTRKVWTFVEECELMHALNDLVLKGNKCDNGFRSGYLLILENILGTKFLGSDLKGEPHINSKIQ